MPTTTAEGGAGADVQVAFTINTYVFVAPARSRGVIDVTSVTRAPNGDILLETRNTGNGFAYLREAKITLKTADGKTIDIAPADIDVGQVSAVSGGATRQVRIPAALAATAAGDVTASIVLL